MNLKTPPWLHRQMASIYFLLCSLLCTGAAALLVVQALPDGMTLLLGSGV